MRVPGSEQQELNRTSLLSARTLPLLSFACYLLFAACYTRRCSHGLVASCQLPVTTRCQMMLPEDDVESEKLMEKYRYPFGTYCT